RHRRVNQLLEHGEQSRHQPEEVAGADVPHGLRLKAGERGWGVRTAARIGHEAASLGLTPRGRALSHVAASLLPQRPNSTLRKSNACTRVGGSIVIIGGLAPDQGGGVAPLVTRNVHATRISVGSRRMFEDMNRALDVGAIRPVIDRVFEFDQALEAYRHLESQQHLGKVVLRV
ncbi:MAG: zinc-binding dehydrogenase, partial [Dehalococcoidia bacterium]|nr:zinc-binding dehydrogenase [Dehalococcoidia bacterium]